MSGFNLPDHIDRNISPEPNSGCWIWLGALDKAGYGKSSQRSSGLRRHLKSHRFVYELLVGKIPEGKFLLHRCDNPCCVNPDHMMVGTQADNIADRDKKGRMSRGESHYRSVLTNEQVIAIRDFDGPLSHIVKKFGISKATASKIKSRDLWKHL